MTRGRIVVVCGAVVVLGLLFQVWRSWVGPHAQKERELRKLDALIEERTKKESQEHRWAEEDERIARGEPEPSSEKPVDIGPNLAASVEEREQSVLEVLTGKVSVKSFPVVATDAGERFDIRLRDRIAPARRATVMPNGRPCDCPPGDPLCSCL